MARGKWGWGYMEVGKGGTSGDTCNSVNNKHKVKEESFYIPLLGILIPLIGATTFLEYILAVYQKL